MAEDMVYRVTRAICDNMNWSEAWPPCEYAGGVCPRCDAIMEGLGRGAIKAMREPTEEMLTFISFKSADDLYRYQAMIDAALAAPKQPGAT